MLCFFPDGKMLCNCFEWKYQNLALAQAVWFTNVVVQLLRNQT